jgi:hypothetical protein
MEWYLTSDILVATDEHDENSLADRMMYIIQSHFKQVSSHRALSLSLPACIFSQGFPLIIEVLQLDSISEFSAKYVRSIGQWRNPSALFHFAARLQHLSGYTGERALVLYLLLLPAKMVVLPWPICNFRLE